MNLKLLATAAVVTLAAASAQAQQPTAPGQQMKEKGSVSGTNGASGYAPGQQMKEKGSVKGTTGASGYAPGHSGDANTSGSAKTNGGARTGGSVR